MSTAFRSPLLRKRGNHVDYFTLITTKKVTVKERISQIWTFVKSLNFSFVLLVLLSLRAVILGANIGDALFVLPICILIGFQMWNGKKEDKDTLRRLSQELLELRTHMASLSGFKKRQEQKSINNFWG